MTGPDGDLDAAVLGAARGIIGTIGVRVRRYRVGLSVPGVGRGCGDVTVGRQPIAHRLGALLAQRYVVGGRSDRIGIAVDVDRAARLFEHWSEYAERLFGVGRERVLVEREQRVRVHRVFLAARRGGRLDRLDPLGNLPGSLGLLDRAGRVPRSLGLFDLLRRRRDGGRDGNAEKDGGDGKRRFHTA